MANAIKNDLKELSLLGAFAALGIASRVGKHQNIGLTNFKLLQGMKSLIRIQGLQPIWVDVRSQRHFASMHCQERST